MRNDTFLFGTGRMSDEEAIRLVIQSLHDVGSRYRHWAIAWSGGKDSTTLLTLVLNLLRAGLIEAPETLTVFYADTRMEIVPLWLAARKIKDQVSNLEQVRALGVEVREVMAELDDRFLVYMLGKGVPPPSNRFRWCTGQMKVEPMERAIRELYERTGEKTLMLTGVRQGESAVRDGRISMSCSKDGSECGQGWFFEMGGENSPCDTLAPILHFRVCLVWDWLKIYAPSLDRNLFPSLPGVSGGSWATALIADAYGGDAAEEQNARTGCMGCPLASQDKALTAVVKMPQWNYLAPLLYLKPMYREMKHGKHRIRQPGGQRKKDGSLEKNQQRMGPLTMNARREFLQKFMAIQFAINAEADRLGRPRVDFLNAEETARILELQDQNTWPDGWTGTEPEAAIPHNRRYSDGSVWLNMFAEY